MGDKTFNIPIWWYELHGDTLSIRAKSKEEAVKKAKAIIERLGDHGYEFTPTFVDMGEYGVDEDE